MPWKSDQQRKWGHSEAGKKALGGEAAVHEWDEATKGKKLPKRVEKSEKDPTRWEKAKKAVERSKGKKEADFGDREFKLTSYVYHKMGKSQEDIQKAEELRKALIAPPKPTTSLAGPGNTATSVPNPAKTGQTGVRTPKSKKLGSPFGKMSLINKSEVHPTVRKLSDFLTNRKSKQS